MIPERFFVLRPWFLEPFWKEFHAGWSYWENVGVNIGGFIPLGFFFCAYLTLVWRMERATMVTVALGLLVSLTIEVSQAFLPSRDSGTTDLFTNAFGTWIGVVAYRHRLVQTALARLERFSS
jgi:glycopeptide antibiotics resistance protein